jgi:CubicO group peptidase (beta-lactamase class C family)
MEKIPEIPAIAICIIKDDVRCLCGPMVWPTGNRAFPQMRNTLFYIASSTKSFTALAAALLDKEGLIKLDDPFTKYTTGLMFKKKHSGKDHYPGSSYSYQWIAE